MRYVVLPTFKKSFPPKTGLTANGSWLTFELNSSIQFSWDCKLIWQLVLSILVLLHSTCRCEFRMADVRIMSKAFGQLQNKWNWIIRTLCMGANVAWAATRTQQLNGWATCGKFNPNRSKKKKKNPKCTTQKNSNCYMKNSTPGSLLHDKTPLYSGSKLLETWTWHYPISWASKLLWWDANAF